MKWLWFRSPCLHLCFVKIPFFVSPKETSGRSSLFIILVSHPTDLFPLLSQPGPGAWALQHGGDCDLHFTALPSLCQGPFSLWGSVGCLGGEE